MIMEFWVQSADEYMRRIVVSEEDYHKSIFLEFHSQNSWPFFRDEASEVDGQITRDVNYSLEILVI